MNPQPDQDLERRLQKLDAELNQTSASPAAVPQSQKNQQLQTDNSQPIQTTLNRFINWFKGMSGFGKLIVIGIAAVVGFAILRAVLQLVASLISLALLGVVVYFVYQFFVARSSKN